MSSMRNAIQRRNHRERAQPVEREKWGVLEKHKDYSLRAKDYNEKKKRLQILRLKAAERNPDEFRFGMTSSKTHDKGQKLANRGNPKLSQDAVKLLKTQDVGYLRTMAQRARRARERLEQDYVVQGGTDNDLLLRESDQNSNRRTIFVETKQQQDMFSSKEAISRRKPLRLNPSRNQSTITRDDVLETDMNEDGEQIRYSQIGISLSSHFDNNQKLDSLKEDRILQKQRKRIQKARESRLKLLKLQEVDLLAAVKELELQRGKMNNSIRGTTKAGVKWKIRERKK